MISYASTLLSDKLTICKISKNWKYIRREMLFEILHISGTCCARVGSTRNFQLKRLMRKRLFSNGEKTPLIQTWWFFEVTDNTEVNVHCWSLNIFFQIIHSMVLTYFWFFCLHLVLLVICLQTHFETRLALNPTVIKSFKFIIKSNYGPQ